MWWYWEQVTGAAKFWLQQKVRRFGTAKIFGVLLIFFRRVPLIRQHLSATRTLHSYRIYGGYGCRTYGGVTVPSGKFLCQKYTVVVQLRQFWPAERGWTYGWSLLHLSWPKRANRSDSNDVRIQLTGWATVRFLVAVIVYGWWLSSTVICTAVTVYSHPGEP